MRKSNKITSFISKIRTTELFWPLLTFCLFWPLMYIHSGIYEFTLGDNLVQFLPGMVHNGRELFSGSIPLINYHHFLGYESILTGYYGGFYLPTYASYFIAHYLFGNDFSLLAILASYHYFVAFIGFYLLLRRFLKHKAFCCIAVLGYVFAAKYINYSAEWWYVLVPMAYLPWITLFSLKVIDRLREPHFDRSKTVMEVLLLSLFLSLMAFAGNSQFTLVVYVCGSLFAFLYFLTNIHTIRWKRFVYLLLILPIVAIGMTSALFSGEYVKESDSKNGHKSVDYMIGNKLRISDAPKSFFIAPLNHTTDFSTATYDSAHERFKAPAFWPAGFVNGAGIILFILFLPWCLLKVIQKPETFNTRKKVILIAFLLAVLGVVLACGYRPIFEFLAQSERLSKLAHAHKYYFIALFYISLFTGTFLGTLLENTPKKIQKTSYNIVLLLAVFTTIVNIVVVTQITHWNFTNESLPIQPNTLLPKEKRMVHMGDFFDYQPEKNVCGEYMGFSCASLFDYHVFGNYEPLLPIQQSFDLNNIAGRTDAGYHDFSYGLYEILKEFGVCNIVGRYSYRSPEDTVREMRIAEGRSVISKISEEAYLVEDLDCYEYKSDRGLVTDREYHGDKMVFTLQDVDQDTTLHVKNYYLDRYRAFDQDGTPLSLTVTVNEETIIGRNMIDVSIPAGTTQVTIRYHHPVLVFLFWSSFLLYGTAFWLTIHYFRNLSSIRGPKKDLQKSLKLLRSA